MIPETRLRRQGFKTNFAFSRGARPAHPYNLKLRLIVSRLNFQNFARLDPAAYSLYYCSGTADISYSGQLHEGQRVSVHAPDPDGKHCGDSRIAATVHSEWNDRMAWGRVMKLTPVTAIESPKSCWVMPYGAGVYGRFRASRNRAESRLRARVDRHRFRSHQADWPRSKTPIPSLPPRIPIVVPSVSCHGTWGIPASRCRTPVLQTRGRISHRRIQRWA